MEKKTSFRIVIRIFVGVVVSIIIFFLFYTKQFSYWRKILFLSYFVSLLFTPFCILIAKKINAVDYPDKRRIHKVPTPRLGGLAVYLAFLVPVFMNINVLENIEIMGLVLGASIIFILGVVEDVKGTSARTRIFFQVLASFIIIAFGMRIDFIPHWGILEYPLEVFITLVWIVGITNAFNFLDGVDGLATGLSLITSLCFFLTSWIIYDANLAPFIIAVMGGSLAFLIYNFKTARIFLGDSGSTLLGFLLASFAIIGTWAYNDPVVSITIPLLILGVPIFDMIYTTISRVKNNSVKTIKEWLEFTGKDHFHHRLINIGFSEIQSVIFIYAVTLSLGLLAVVLKNADRLSAVLLLTNSVILFLIIVSLMLVGRRKY